MKSAMRSAITMALLVASALLSWSGDLKATQEREFPVSTAAAQAALQNLGAYTGSRLPSLEGFVKLEGVHVQEYQRPYYEFKIDLLSAASGRTVVRVKANISAWYVAPNMDPGYRVLESNGRLESDLLDRLGEYLKDKAADAATLAQWIATVHAQRISAEGRVAELQGQLQKAETSQDQPPEQEFVSVTTARVPVLSQPNEKSTALLRAQVDDEFQVLEHRGVWLRVRLDGAHSGWVKQAYVQSATPVATNDVPSQPRAIAPGFSIIREMVSDFSGDWPRLKGKKALYLWAQPDGTVLNLPTGNRLQFVQSVFLERYREIAHTSQHPVDGIVVIFVDAHGAVAAAALDDIRLWAEGAMTQSAFLKKCSLDPRTAFLNPSSMQPIAGLTHPLDTQAVFYRHHFPDLVVDAFSPGSPFCWRRASTFCTSQTN